MPPADRRGGRCRQRSNRSDVEIDATGLWEPGPVVSRAEWDRFTAVYRATLAEADVVVLSGSLPRGVPSRAYQQLIAAAADAGVPAVLDTDGPALRHGLRAEPAVAKPNAAELAGIVGQPITDTGSAITAAGLARLLGARDLVDSLEASAWSRSLTRKPGRRSRRAGSPETPPVPAMRPSLRWRSGWPRGSRGRTGWYAQRHGRRRLRPSASLVSSTSVWPPRWARRSRSAGGRHRLRIGNAGSEPGDELLAASMS